MVEYDGDCVITRKFEILRYKYREVSIKCTPYEWTCNGILHRIAGPARESRDGRRTWYYEGKIHRATRYDIQDGPAIEHRDGSREWFIHGVRHRANGPACLFAWENSYIDPDVVADLVNIFYLPNAPRFRSVREEAPHLRMHLGSRGVITRENATLAIWYQWGCIHNEEGPAVIHALPMGPKGSRFLDESYVLHGKLCGNKRDYLRKNSRAHWLTELLTIARVQTGCPQSPAALLDRELCARIVQLAVL